jgi:hypothetical protein
MCILGDPNTIGLLVIIDPYAGSKRAVLFKWGRLVFPDIIRGHSIFAASLTLKSIMIRYTSTYVTWASCDRKNESSLSLVFLESINRIFRGQKRGILKLLKVIHYRIEKRAKNDCNSRAVMPWDVCLAALKGASQSSFVKLWRRWENRPGIATANLGGWALFLIRTSSGCKFEKQRLLF